MSSETGLLLRRRHRPNRLPLSLLLKAQSVSWHVCIFHYFQFSAALRRKRLAGSRREERRERERERRNRMKGRREAERTKNNITPTTTHSTCLQPPPFTPPLHKKRGGRGGQGDWICGPLLGLPVPLKRTLMQIWLCPCQRLLC